MLWAGVISITLLLGSLILAIIDMFNNDDYTEKILTNLIFILLLVGIVLFGVYVVTYIR